MRYQQIGDGTVRTYVAVLDQGDEVMECLRTVADEEELDAASITAIGALEEATLAWYDLDAQQYRDIPVREQGELLSLVGDVTRAPDGRMVHAHAVLGLRDGSTRGGHVKRGIVRPTLEAVVTESPAHLRRTYDPSVGLALIDLESVRS